MSACFADEAHGPRGTGGPQELDAETQQCIIGIGGSLPENPGDLNREQKGLIAQQCLADDQRRGGQRGGGQARSNTGRSTPVSSRMSPAVRRCIVALVGRVPSTSNDLTDSEKRLIDARCFERRQVRGPQCGPGARLGRTGQSRSGRGPAEASGGQQTSAGTSRPGQASGGPSSAPASSGQSSQGPTGSQQASRGQQAPAAPAPAPVAQPAAAPSEPELVLTDIQRQIQRAIINFVIINFNEVKEMEVTGVIGRLSGVLGSMTSSIKTLSVVNNLLVKGRVVTNAEWKEVFDKLED